MKLYKDGTEVDYNDLDKEISTHFDAPFNPETFCILPNTGTTTYLTSMDWYEILNQACEESGARNYEEVTNYYIKDYINIMIMEKKRLQKLLPQLYNLIDYLKEKNVIIR